MTPADRIQLRISDDRLEAWARITEGPAAEPDVFDAQLESASIRFGRLPEVCSQLALALGQSNDTGAERLIASGQPPEPGEPARLVLEPETGLAPGSQRIDGSLDFRERQLILPIAVKDPIGRILPSTPGKPGRDVCDDPIEPPPIAEFDPKLGDGIEELEDGRLISKRNGARTIQPDGSIDVVDLHVHAGNVDLSSGNLRSKGSLEISRDVADTMRVEADFDLRIGGAIDGASVYAGQSIEIKGGAIGRDSGHVRAGGDLSVRHALGIVLDSGGVLQVARSVSVSELKAREIDVGGALLSNIARAESRIAARTVGSPAGGPCTLRVAYPLAPPTAVDSNRPRPIAGSSPRPRRKSGALNARKGRRSKSIGAGPAKKEVETRSAWRERQRALQSKAVIEISGTAHAGIRVDFGVRPLLIETDRAAVRFRLDAETQEIVCEDL